MNIKKLFGKKIKEKRLGLELTQEQLAEKIGISSKSLSQIELGNNFVSAENLDAICTALKTSPKQLFDFAEEVEQNDNYEYVMAKLLTNRTLLNKISKIIPVIE